MKENNSSNGSETNISLLYRGLNPRAFWQSLVKAQLGKLQHLASISLARITLERQKQSKPAFRVLAVLEVPGPDYHAEATDYTLRAALLKVVDNLRRQMESRKHQQLTRRKHKAQLGFLGNSNLSRI